jgi:hypothetical protein
VQKGSFDQEVTNPTKMGLKEKMAEAPRAIISEKHP